MGRSSTYTCSKSHNLSADKSLRCPTWKALLFSIMRAAHSVIMNHWKWALNREVSEMPISTISDVLSMLINWWNRVKRSFVPNVPSANSCFGAQKSVRKIRLTFFLHQPKWRWICLLKLWWFLPFKKPPGWGWGGGFPSSGLTIWRQPSFQMSIILLLSWILTHNHNSLSATPRENELGTLKNYL